jgi:hypothetical protein
VPLDIFLPPSNLAFTPSTEPYLLAAFDHNGLNAGVLLIKANMWCVHLLSRVLLDPVLPNPSTHTFNDQASLSRILHADPQGVALHLWAIPQTWLNDYSAETHWDSTVQTHLVNHLKMEKSHFPYLQHVAKIYEESKGDVNLLLKRPEVAKMTASAKRFWQIAKPGIDGLKLMLDG